MHSCLIFNTVNIDMSKRILIIDDDLYIRELYEEVLKTAGFQVVGAVDGKVGLIKIIEGGFDLILLDVMMPELDGIQVLHALKITPPKKSNGKIILLTNLSHDPTIQEGLNSGAAAYLIKADITPDQLVSKVTELIN